MKNIIRYFCITVFLLYFFWLIRSAILGQLTGIFVSRPVPRDYTDLNNYLISQHVFYRTLWIPTIQRFAYYSSDHPAIDGYTFFQAYDPISEVRKLQLSNSENALRNASVKYVIVPVDTEGELFLQNRKYSSALYSKTKNAVSTISYLVPVQRFGSLGVFEVKNYHNHFWSTNKKLLVSFTQFNPTKYTVSLTNAHVGDRIIFSEAFDQNWIANIGNTSISPIKYQGLYNEYVLPKGGNFHFTVVYKIQQWVQIGQVVSMSTVFVLLLFYLYILRFKIGTFIRYIRK